MARIAFTTFAILNEPYGGERVKGYEDITPPVFGAAEQAEGFIDRAREIDDRPDLSNFERDWGIWGPFRAPRFYQGGTTLNTDSRASTVSLWRDLPSVYRFVYTGLHGEALAGRKQWFLKPQWPGYAMWWVDDEHIPTWSEACQRLEHLHDHGSTPFAFDFRRPFVAEGTPAKRPRLRRRSAR